MKLRREESGIWLEPTRSVVLGKDRAIGAMARSVAVRTQWTQDRTAKAGYADENDTECRLCGVAEGTKAHRNSANGCEQIAKWRNEYITDLDKAFIDKYRPKLLIERSILLNSECGILTRLSRKVTSVCG